MQTRFWRLQLFADGGDGGASGGEGAAASGVTPADAGQGTQERTLADVLRERGVPEEKLQRRAYQRKVQTAGTPAGQEQAQAAVAGQEEQQEQKTDGQSQSEKPEKTYTKGEVESIVKKRFAKNAAKVEALDTLTPSLEMLSKRYGVEPGDYAGLSAAIMDDDAFYQQKALDMGVNVDTAKRITRAEMLEDAFRKQQEQNLQDQMIRDRFDDLGNQAEELRKTFPDFDLDRELQSRDFVFMTQPNGVSLKKAYFAEHAEEILEQAKQSAQRAMASTIASGQMRPNETGTKKAGSAPAARPNMSKEHREELKQRFRSGEKITAEMMY